MQWLNNNDAYGIVHKILHWLIAILVFGLFALGLWMVDLDYYSAWYKTAPDLHRSFGIVVVALMIVRLVLKQVRKGPLPLESHSAWERLLAKVVHCLLYVLVISMFISGYLITTVKGQGLDFFSLFTIPATIEDVENLDDIAAEVHELAAFTIIGLVGLHVLGALKHSFIDRDGTLRRMFKG